MVEAFEKVHLVELSWISVPRFVPEFRWVSDVAQEKIKSDGNPPMGLRHEFKRIKQTHPFYIASERIGPVYECHLLFMNDPEENIHLHYI